MDQEIRIVLSHGGEGDHAAIVSIDTPALAGDIAAPDKGHIAAIRRRGAEAADHGLADDVGMREIAEFDAVEDVLPGRQIIEQQLRREIALGQRRDNGGNMRALLKDSVVATSTIICAGRSARDQIMPLLVPTSPDCTPCDTTGRSAARLR
jgi:hypothetical protein